MTRTDLCAGGDGRITFVRQGRWKDEVWVHEDGTRFRDGHVAQPAPQCPKCGSPKYVTEKTDPWTVRCMECGHEEEAMNNEERVAAVMDANKFELFDQNIIMREALTAIRDLAYRGVGSPADALEAIQFRAARALEEVR